ncbi:MAG: 50S ribosomal protein L29 [Candidatus Promineifilaceae bacterium]
MANIVELREKNNVQLEEMLTNGREEMFNLRFQKAISQLKDGIRIRTVRRELAQVQSVLGNRQLAITAASQYPEIASALSGVEWDASARYVYEDQGFQVEFTNNGSQVASALVNLNVKAPKTRRQRDAKAARQLVKRYEIN